MTAETCTALHLDHVGALVSDLPEATAWYREILDYDRSSVVASASGLDTLASLFAG